MFTTNNNKTKTCLPVWKRRAGRGKIHYRAQPKFYNSDTSNARGAEKIRRFVDRFVPYDSGIVLKNDDNARIAKAQERRERRGR